MTRFSPALDYVIECARRSCGADARLLPPEPNWHDVFRVAEVHSLFAAVAAVVDAQERHTDFHDSRHEIVVRAAVAQMQRRLRQEPGISRVLSLLCDTGRQPVVLKGAALAYTEYARPEFRSFADLDVLLPAHVLQRANDTLIAAGFVTNTVASIPDGHHHLPPLFAPQREIVVELHRTLFDAHCPFRIEIDDWIARAEPATILGHEVRVLSAPDALLHTCAHLSYSHRYLRFPLRSLMDILALTRSRGMDWAAVVVRTRRAGMSGAVVWPLAVARAWLGAPVPDQVIQALLPPAPLRSFIGTAMGSGYILDRESVSNDGTAVAYERLLELSILGHFSIVECGKTVLSGLFPSANATRTPSPGAPALSKPHRFSLVRPARIGRGIRALSRLITQRQDWADQLIRQGM